jgi:hypothetical protein
MKRLIRAAAGVSAVLIISCSIASRACVRQIAWGADLVKAGAKPSTASKPAGTVDLKFDFQKPYGTLTVQTPNVHGVQFIELRRVRYDGDFYGPVVAWIYRPADGPYRGRLVKHLGDPDVIPLAHPVKDGYNGLPDELLHRRIVVAVCTKSHPKGEVMGVITGRLVVNYSVGGDFHDPKLHHPPASAGI